MVGYAETPQQRTTVETVTADPEADARIHRLKTFGDARGDLLPLDLPGSLPFTAQRVFFVYGVPSKEVRGEHAHRRCHQFLVAVHGSVSCIVDDGATRAEYVLDSPGLGLHMPPLTWGTQYNYSPDAVLAVFASRPYEDADYIRDYDEFRALTQA
ncbi:sugar 3,4-ketoisomerase [Schumannella luteola]|uniref:sugar 3,4-ketoisomerase n=1 Tax=Schumannella luteola TaxID=472059 RepID=UPI003CCD89FD